MWGHLRGGGRALGLGVNSAVKLGEECLSLSGAVGQPGPTRFPHLSNGGIVPCASQGCAEPVVEPDVNPGPRLGPVLATPLWYCCGVHERPRRPSSLPGTLPPAAAVVLTQDCSVYEDIPCCRTCLLIALSWFQSWGRKYMLVPVDPRPWPGCQQHGWVGAGGSACPLAPFTSSAAAFGVFDPEGPEQVEI